MKLNRLKHSWLISNRHYLLPVFLVIAAVNAALAAVLAVFALLLWFINILRARLPIDVKSSSDPETICYKQAGNTELKLDLWRAVNASGRGTKTYPTIVFAHGGGWISGFRNQPNITSWCRFLSDRGFAVASIDYRFAYTNRMQDITEDFSDAVEYIRSNAEALGISGRIILMGLSAGGHLALHHAALNTSGIEDSDQAVMDGVLGVVAYYPPSDLKDLFSSDDKSFFARFGAGTAMKTLPRFNEESYERFSPINNLTAAMVPVMTVHGRKDEVVPYSSSVKFVKRLKELGVPCRFLIHNTGMHGFEVRLKDYRTTLILEETVRFMKKLASKK